MGRKRKADPAADNPTLEKLYIYHLWKDRANWTGHKIPVRTVDPRTGFFVEAYIYAPALIKDPDAQEIIVELAFITIFNKSQFITMINCIYPSKRLITKIVDNQIITLPTVSEFDPQEMIPLEHLNEIFVQYKGLSFTVKEMESMLNQPIPADCLNKLVLAGERQCLISNTLQPAYKMQTSGTISNDPASLYLAYKDCTSCELGSVRKARGFPEPVFGRCETTSLKDINSKIELFIIGEAPGVQEEAQGLPFVPDAPAGGVLNKVLTAAEIDPKTVYYTNSVMCRPESTNPNTQNGKPSVEHIRACNTRLKNELAIFQPKVVLLLGKYAYRSFYGKDPENVLSMVGWQNEKKTIFFAPHPSFIVRELTYASPEQVNAIKTKYLSHFIDIKKKIDE